MFKSIQMKLVTIYILLILLAMEVVGVYLLQSLERYHIKNFSTYLNGQAQIISNLLSRYLVEEKKVDEIQVIVEGYIKQISPTVECMLVLDDKSTVLASTNEEIYPRGKKILQPELIKASFGQVGEEIRLDSSKGRYDYLAYPIKENNRVVGIVYLISPMESIYETLSEIKTILFTATLIALLITGVLGYSLSKTITGPIQEVTNKAALLAEGNFDQKIEVKSKDEVGKLTEMFNFLAGRLKETLEQISEEKNKMEAIFKNMADGVIALDKEGEVIYVNPAAFKLLEVEEGNSYRVLGKKLKEELKIDIKEEIKSQKDFMAKINDSILKVIIAPMKREEKTAGFILILHDITKEQKLEEMRREFVANVSHELRTPLTTIKSYTETLLDGALNDEEVSMQFLNVINEETDRMTRIVNDLLELSRLDNKEARFNKKAINLSKVLAAAVSKMKVNAKKKGITICENVKEDLPLCYADADKMEQVFQNILSNAIKYTPEGGNITVNLWCESNFVITSIKDTGIGIPREDLPRIFERFYRVDKTRSREFGGTGLGLSIAKEIVKAHEGEIEIKSELGEGTEVTVKIPCIV
ncbi:two-component system histidine kinase PnpS [Thermovenabulum gondwanense]|uniref:histidine kinase n=1 Tax=Thermovenabulum gondwanense TaxID=520767 RepID=A0A162MIP0_9FIRM|nr:ATP-binding protein [Thermovenabulum gondwanense]KYO66158.1 Sensor histidine kinase YycG [Thermovenabulum gondwanense]